MSEGTQIHQKTINNAISAYLMLFISGAFLFNKSNEYINNNFVKSHTKVAFLIHIGFLLTYIIFINQSFLKAFSIFGYQVSYIVASSIFILLFTTLLYGIHKAKKSQAFKLGDFIHLGKKEKIVSIHSDAAIDEKDKFTLILSYIPFVGYIINGQNHQNKHIQLIVFLNMLVSLIISIIYIYGYINITLIFSLFYIIFVVFSSISLITNDSIIEVDMRAIPKPETKITLLKSAYKYLQNYITKKEFIGIKQLQSSLTEKREKEEIFNNKILEEKKDVTFPKILIYIPILNLFTLKFLDSKQRFHIINGLIITLICILIFILSYFYIVSAKNIILLLFPITFGIGYIESRPAYKMPFIYEIFETFVKMKNMFVRSKKIIKKKQAEEYEEVLKVSDNLHSQETNTLVQEKTKG